MAIFYRAIWAENRSDACAVARAAFSGWVSRKSQGGVSVPGLGTVTGTSLSRRAAPTGVADLVEHGAEVEVEHAQQDGRSALRATFVEHKPDGSRWATTLRAWSGFAEPEDQVAGSWLWVDVAAVFDQPPDRLTVAAPALVHDLLKAAVAPRRRCVPLTSDATLVSGEAGAEKLAALLTHTDRDVPVVVFAPELPLGQRPASVGSVLVEAAMRTAARRTAGVAATYGLDAEAAQHLALILGEDFGVPPGAFRLYAPELDPARAHDDWRHRWTPPERYLRYTSTAGQLIAGAVAPLSAARRAPTSYTPARALLASVSDREASDWQALAELAEEQGAAQRELASAAEDRYLDILGDYEQAQLSLVRLREQEAQARSDLERALSLLRGEALDQRFWEAKAGDRPSTVPLEADSPSQAVLYARQHLARHLSVHDKAPTDLEDLDAAIESRAWGQSSWEAFRALAAYAQERASGTFAGSFWTWCQSGHPLVWRATSKKLAMVESETLRNNETLWEKRMLPVSTAYAPTGRMRMESHIKIAEGGGNLAPRIYFVYDDPGRRMHVGYFGPHKHMPNSRT